MSKRQFAGQQRVLSRHEADPRKALVTAAEQRRVTLAALARMLDRPSGYLARFVRDGHPLALRPTEHTMLSQFFGLSEREMGVRNLWQPL